MKYELGNMDRYSIAVNGSVMENSEDFLLMIVLGIVRKRAGEKAEGTVLIDQRK